MSYATRSEFILVNISFSALNSTFSWKWFILVLYLRKLLFFSNSYPTLSNTWERYPILEKNFKRTVGPQKHTSKVVKLLNKLLSQKAINYDMIFMVIEVWKLNFIIRLYFEINDANDVLLYWDLFFVHCIQLQYCFEMFILTTMSKKKNLQLKRTKKNDFYLNYNIKKHILDAQVNAQW